MKNYNYVWELLGQILALLVQCVWFWSRILLTKLMCTFVGALTGLVIGWFFGTTILGILAQIGITGYSMWQIGAFLGFIGSFFGHTQVINKTDKQETDFNKINKRMARY